MALSKLTIRHQLMGDFEKKLNEMRSQMNADIAATILDARERIKEGEKISKIMI